jgi:hypothetical protein
VFAPPAGSHPIDAHEAAPPPTPAPQVPLPDLWMPTQPIAHPSRPQIMLRVFAPVPAIEPAQAHLPAGTATATVFLLEATGSSRLVRTVAESLAGGDERKSNSTARTLEKLFKTTPGSIVHKDRGLLKLADGVASDYRWIAALGEAAGNPRLDTATRWAALTELVNEAQRIRAAAYGGIVTTDFAWAFDYDTATTLTAEALATSILADALANRATNAWLDLTTSDAPAPVDGRHMVTMLLHVESLLSDSVSEPLFAAAARIATKTGDHAVHDVRHSVSRRRQTGWHPPAALLDELGL